MLNEKQIKLISGDIKKDDNFFKVKFDIIISIQVLYYLNNLDLKKRLVSLNNMLKSGGYVFFTMMGTKNKYFQKF